MRECIGSHLAETEVVGDDGLCLLTAGAMEQEALVDVVCTEARA